MKKFYQIILKVTLISLFGIIPVIFYGQETEEKVEIKVKEKTGSFDPYWFFGGHIGASFFHGDVARYDMAPDWNKIDIGGDLYFGRQFTSVFGLDIRFYRAFLDGEKKGLNRTFDSDLYDYTINAKFNFSNLFSNYKPDRFITVHGLIGFGQVQYKSRLYDYTTDNRIRTLGFKNSTGNNNTGNGINGRRVIAIIPVGLGFDFALAESWDLNLDWTLKFCDSDLIDGYAGGAKPVKQDMYSFLGIGATYKFGYASGIKNMVKDYDLVKFEATPKVLKEKGGIVEVTVKGTIPEKYFGKKAAMYFEPVLVYEGGEYPLKPITLIGEDVVGDGIVINNKTGGTFTYSDNFPFIPEMAYSVLVVEPIVYQVKETIHPNKNEIKEKVKFEVLGERKLADGVIYTSKRIVDSEIILISPHGYEKETIITEAAKIFFPVNRYNLNWALPMNKLQASKDNLKTMFDFVALGWDIKDIDIKGWASPEGEETFNDGLSENRANTAYKYMLKKLKKLIRAKNSLVNFKNPKEDITFNITSYGPDWNGFLKAVKASDIADKNVILNVINSAGDALKKEQEIRNMILIYPEIEEYLLPPLRRAGITVNCYEPKRTDEEIAQLATTYPDSLNIEEILYAATLTDEYGNRLTIYETIIIAYPNNWTAYNNAAAINLSLGNLDEAAVLLDKANNLSPNNAEILNNLGVLACYIGDYSDAEALFKKAQSYGADESYNLGIIEIVNGSYDKALKLFGATKCDYNVALAQMLTEDFTKAEKNLNCAEKDAANYYLLAVIGAHTDNSSMIFDNLIKAVELDASYKIQAKYDREFLNYENDPNFKAIVE